ncbi:MAG: hypothetical protein ACRDIU_06340 [Actinomycetota bacterium]
MSLAPPQASKLYQLAIAIGLSDDGRAFKCPACQLGRGRYRFYAPAAVLLVGPGDLVKFSATWRCLKCGATGTYDTARRLVSENVDIAS